MKAHHLACIAIAGCVLGGFLPAQTRAAAPAAVLRLSGTFMQYQDEMQTWPPETWRAVLDSMREAKLNTVIIQMLVRENNDGTTHSFIAPPGQADATETILEYADSNSFRVFLGLYLPNWNHDMLGSNFLFETQAKMADVARQAWDRYLANGRHSSFAGWYIPYESWTANYQPAEVSRLRAFFSGTDAACREVTGGDMPTCISPFISPQRPPPCRVEELYREILNQSGIDILLLQDSVGAQQWETDLAQRVGPYFRSFKNACDATGVQLWANLESFRITNGVFAPCDVGRFRKQFEATAPFAEQFVTFDFLHYMNPVAFLSWWDQARRQANQQLYADYLANFVSQDYAPFAAPALAVSLAGDHLALSWTGMPGDLFNLQFTTNLADEWTPVNTAQISATGTTFSCTNILSQQAASGFYRVRKLSKLVVPDSMAWIPPGHFLMGTPAGDTNRTAAELPQFEVHFTNGFWIGKFEVTQSKYQNRMCTNPASFNSDLNNPVERVSWTEASDYCQRLTQAEREAGRLPAGYVYRLPSEAEWEYATRAGSTNLFCSGDDPAGLGGYAWYNVNSGQRTHTVGTLVANAWQLKDVHGNVLEWCWDWIDAAPQGPVTNFVGSISGPYHALRGGAWPFAWSTARSSWRLANAPFARQPYLGFRVVLAGP